MSLINTSKMNFKIDVRIMLLSFSNSNADNIYSEILRTL